MAAVVLLGLVTAPSSRLGVMQPASLSLVATAWAPFTNPPGQPRFALDLVEAALGRVHISTQTTFVTPAEFGSALVSGKYDGAAAVWRDSVRERVLVFSQPYLENRLVLIGRSGADVSAKTLAELAGKRVAIVDGFSYGEAIETGRPVWIRSASEEDSLRSLLDGTADYTLMDALVVEYLLRSHPREAAARLAIGSTPVITKELYFAVSRMRVDAETIVGRFNAQLRGMIRDRTYHKLLHVEWIEADVDGDGIPEFVPASDTPGPIAPTHAYSLFTTRRHGATGPEKPGFYVGGHIYEDWTRVPDAYKRVSPQHPDPRQSTATLFRFTW